MRRPNWAAGHFQVSVDDLQREMSQFLNKLYHAGVRTGPLDGQDWSPTVDIINQPEAIIVRAEVSGCTVHDIEVTLGDQQLVIRGEKHDDEPPGGASQWLRRERRFGKFAREIDLPCEVREDAITATVRNGVLRVVLPKLEDATPKAVRISVSDDEAGPAT